LPQAASSWVTSCGEMVGITAAPAAAKLLQAPRILIGGRFSFNPSL
jgi:hypothetical protein